jgi:outer membrane protein OmpA-like peptidoglycan-associated protein
VFISIEQNSHGIHAKQIKKLQQNKIQISSMKAYSRTRKTYVPEHSFALAEHDIKKILLKDPIYFEVNHSSFLVKSTLIKIVKIVNAVKENVVLSILAHTNASGTAQDNLQLSQKMADKLKEYFLKRTNLPLVVAIGYGEVFSLKKRLIEINLKRIKE